MAFITLCIGLFSLLSLKQQTVHSSEITSNTFKAINDTSKVIVDVYFETLCPDSKEFIVEQVYPNYLTIGSIMKVNLVPFGKASFDPQADGSVKFECQHGMRECIGNKIESCVLNLIPEEAKQMKFINCMSQTRKPWEKADATSCATSANFDYTLISQCVQSTQGDQFLLQEGRKTKAIDPPLHYVPWVVFNKKFDETLRRESYSNLKKVVCDLYKGPKIDACNSGI